MFHYAVMTDFSNVYRDASMGVFTTAVTGGFPSIVTVSQLPPTIAGVQDALAKDSFIKILSGTGVGQIRRITGVSGNVIDVLNPWHHDAHSTSQWPFCPAHRVVLKNTSCQARQ